MITLHPFGSLPDGQAVTRYRLENQQGAYADILDYGGIIQSLWVPDRTGALVDVSLGYDDLSGYLQGSAHLGASLGRYANRICGASFPLLGKTISLTPNSGDNCLHGGSQGFDRYLWAAQVQGDTLALRRTSPDGEAGFPGNLQAE
ncbi:MAG: galactose-1-epimerase, partial [Clostridiales bacterium]